MDNQQSGWQPQNQTPTPDYSPMPQPVQPGWQPTMTQPPQNLTSTALATPLPFGTSTTPTAAVKTQSSGVPFFIWIIFIVLVLGAAGLAAAVFFMK